MTKHLEYIIIAATAFIFTFYHAILTSIVISRFDNVDFSFAFIFIIEIIAFAPIAIGMFLVMWVGKKWSSLFTSFSYSNLLIHAGVAILLFLIHALWQPAVNTVFFKDSFEFANFTSDFISFLEMRFLIYVIIVGLVTGLIKIREQQQVIVKQSDLYLKLQQARLKEIELKMNPEIIYPNLGFIKAKAIKKPDEASQMVILMAGILRKLVDNIEGEKVRLFDEATFLSMYLDLVKLRLEKPIEVYVKLEQKLEGEKVPSMILVIPFFEELFFGDYTKSFIDLESVSFSANKTSNNTINEVISIRNISDPENLIKKLKEESLIEKVNEQLKNLSEERFTFNAEMKDEELFLTLGSSVARAKKDVYEK